MPQHLPSGRFIGRAEELARLRDLLTRAAAGAAEEGVRVLHGGCVPLGEDGLPLAPVIQALRARRRQPVEAAAAAHRLGLDRA